MNVVAAFDFDGTLSTRDNLVPYLIRAVGPVRLALAVLAIAPQLVLAKLDDRRRDAAKAALLRRLFAGRDASPLAALAAKFADDVVAHHLRADVAQRLTWHQANGHRVVLVSAALSLCLDPIGERLGVDAVLGTELAIDANSAFTGELLGANVRRGEKVRRLDAWIRTTFGDEPVEVWAYGDSTGDRELLARADHPTRVTRTQLSTPTAGGESTR